MRTLRFEVAYESHDIPWGQRFGVATALPGDHNLVVDSMGLWEVFDKGRLFLLYSGSVAVTSLPRRDDDPIDELTLVFDRGMLTEIR